MPQPREPLEVGEDAIVAHAGIAAVPHRVDQLEVVEEHVDVAAQALEGSPRRVAAGVEGGMQAALLGRPQEPHGERGLQQRLPARQGDPAARFLVERAVALHHVEDLLDRHRAPRDLARVGVALVGAGTAGLAAGPAGDGSAVHPHDGAVRAGLDAGPATDAALLVVDHLGPGGLALRIVAPPARQGAPLEKDGAPDAGTVVDGVAPNVEHDAAGQGPSGSAARQCRKPRAAASRGLLRAAIGLGYGSG